MRYIEAITNYGGRVHSLTVSFIAGGITNCPDWQADIVEMLKDTDLTLLNPRRADFRYPRS